jgi:hypothetical protein
MDGQNPGPATLTAHSTLLGCNSAKYLGKNNYTANDTANMFGANTNNNSDTFTTTLTGFNITATGTAFDPTTLSTYFDASGFLGAISGASDTWYKGWTCDDSATANFGSGQDCTSLPTT